MDLPDAEARAAIANVLALYCHAIDRRRWTLIEACFHDDATYLLGATDGSWRNFVTIARGLLGPLPVTHHQLGQTLHLVEGEDVRTETYFTAIHRVPADAPPGVFGGCGHDYHAVVGGRYLDRFARSADGWRIARRVVALDWRHDLSPIADRARGAAVEEFADALTIRPDDWLS